MTESTEQKMDAIKDAILGTIGKPGLAEDVRALSVEMREEREESVRVRAAVFGNGRPGLIGNVGWLMIWFKIAAFIGGAVAVAFIGSLFVK